MKSSDPSAINTSMQYTQYGNYPHNFPSFFYFFFPLYFVSVCHVISGNLYLTGLEKLVLCILLKAKSMCVCVHVFVIVGNLCKICSCP